VVPEIWTGLAWLEGVLLLCIVSGRFLFFGGVLVWEVRFLWGWCFLWGGFCRGEILYFEGMGEVCGVGCCCFSVGIDKICIA